VIRNGWIAGEWGNTHAARIGSVSKSLTALATARMYELSDAGRLGKTIGAESFAYDFLPATWDDDEAQDPNKTPHDDDLGTGAGR
jgi:hypothetical protein